MAISFLKKDFYKDIRFYIVLIGTLPFWMWLIWLAFPKTMMPIAIIDKSGFNSNFPTHISLNWVLKHEKFVKRNYEFFQENDDYFGFFPDKNGKYQLKGLERFSSEQISKLVNDCDLTYFADTYGVTWKEWKNKLKDTARSAILYGGLSRQDMAFAKGMQDAGKLVIAEFNTIGSPTMEPIRKEFEKTFGLTWSGWYGKFFNSFDTIQNKDLPKWIYQSYLNQHNNWPFKKGGIALVNQDGQVAILEKTKDLIKDFHPHILSGTGTQETYDVHQDIPFQNWFDIVSLDNNKTEAISEYIIPVNKRGKAILEKYNIPHRFPAVIKSKNNQQPFYYFAGNFSDNPVRINSAKFFGIGIYKTLLYNKRGENENAVFFWDFYRPLLSHILKDYQKVLKK